MSNELQLAGKLAALEKRVRDLERLENGRFSGARVYNSGAVTIAHNTSTNVTFDSERFDTDAYHNTLSGTARLTAPVAGKYLVWGNVQFASNATGFRQLLISVNETTTIAVARMIPIASNSTILSVTTIYEMAYGDYVVLRVYQNSGGSLDVEAVGNYSPEFAIARLG